MKPVVVVPDTDMEIRATCFGGDCLLKIIRGGETYFGVGFTYHGHLFGLVSYEYDAWVSVARGQWGIDRCNAETIWIVGLSSFLGCELRR